MQYHQFIFRQVKLLLLICFLTISCTTWGQKKTKIPLKDQYLGQKAPGLTAQLFAPDLISSPQCEHSTPAFSPDGKRVLWTIMDANYHGYILEMRYENGAWTKPAKPTFAHEKADDYYPTFSADGKKVYFSSRRKVPLGYPETKDMRIWEVEVTKESWGIPVPFDTTVSTGVEYSHSMSQRGTIYFSSIAKNEKKMEISFSALKNGKYQSPQILNLDSKYHYDGAFIAPDESFLIFESNKDAGAEGHMDLYICFRKNDGTWTAPKNMGNKINTSFGERFARLSPDGKYLFFGSTRSGILDIYWIDAKVIEELKAP